MEYKSMTADQAQAATPHGLAVTCYENAVPPFIEEALERLYGNIFSSLAHFRIYGGLPAQTGVYVERRNGAPVAVFLFDRSSSEKLMRVLNEGMVLDREQVGRFAARMFAAWRAVDIIVFHAVQTEAWQLPFPHQRYHCTEDVVLNLPDSSESYLASLGKNTRRNIRRYMDKLKRDFPSFRYDFHTGDAIDERQVRSIIGFNRERIAGKSRDYAMSEAEVERVVALTKARGLVGVASIDGRICGGSIGYLVGGNYFFKVIGHDPAYNGYSAGILCCYLTIRECIARGCKQLNFMQDAYEYKLALGAVPRRLDHVVIYRSRLHMLRHGGTALAIAGAGYWLRLRLRMLEMASREHGVAAYALNLMRRLRKVRGNPD